MYAFGLVGKDTRAVMQPQVAGSDLHWCVMYKNVL